MEREADLLQSSPSKNLHHRIAAASDALRHVQATFKRQRPIGQALPSACRARRVLVSGKDPSKGIQQGSEKLQSAASERGNITQDVIDQVPPENSSIAPPLATETMTGITTTQEESLGRFDEAKMLVEPDHPRNDVKGRLDCKINTGTYSDVELQHGLADGTKKVQFSSVGNANPACPGPPLQRSSGSAATNTGTENLSSHMTYLVLAESECTLRNQVGMLTTSGQGFKQQDCQQNEMSNISTRSGGTCLLPETGKLVHDQHLMGFLRKDAIHFKTQSSVAGSSCVTTTYAHSMSGPMLNSTSYDPKSHLDGCLLLNVEPLEDFNSNHGPVVQGALALPSGPSSHCTNMALDKQMAESIQLSSSAPESLPGVQDSSLSKRQATIIKEIDRLPVGCVGYSGTIPSDEKSTKGKGCLDEVNGALSQAPPMKNSPSNENLELPQSIKTEKAVSGTSASAGLKKNHDPNMFFKINGKLYQKLGKIGSGGSSEVYKVISSNCTIYALKRIKLKGRDLSTAYGFCQEIEYLNKLKGKNNIIELFDYEVTDKTLLNDVVSGSMTIRDGKIKDDSFIYMVLEYGEIDLAHMLSQKWKEMDSSSCGIDENWLRFYWQQMLQAVNTIHEERIVHSDLKPANFLLVKGSLKLIDFGIAKAIMSDTTNIQRDAQVGTLNYMSPEAFMWNEHDTNGNTIKCGRPSDIWSLGCILYQMVYRKTPFSEHKTFWAKFKVITDQNHEITYEPVLNPCLVDLMKKCLAWDKNERWRIPQLLQHPFLAPPVPSQLLQHPFLAPPVPSQLPTLHIQYSKLLQKMAEAYVEVPEVPRLCSQLQELLENLRDTGDQAYG